MARWAAPVLIALGASALVVLQRHDLALALAVRSDLPALGSRAACGAYRGLPPDFGRNEHAGMVPVAGGSFVPGSNAGYPEERPARPAPSVTVRDFFIDRTEVSNAQFAAFVAATGYVTTAEHEGQSAVFAAPKPGEQAQGHLSWWRAARGVSWRAPEGPGSSLRGRENHPVVHVSYDDALAYARWLGRSLPSEDQWEYAARAGPTTHARHRPPGAAPGPPAADIGPGDIPDHNRVEDGFAAEAPVGCFPANAFGLHDRIGNVWEWTADDYFPRSDRPLHGDEATVAETPTCEDGPTRNPKVIKGGSFLCSPNFCARYRVSARHAHETSVPTAHLGFRTVLAR